jgi:hypothetical protein
MPSISCTEFNRLVEQTIETRSPVDTPELRAHAAVCADCQAAWLDAMLLEGAVAHWKKTATKMAPPVDLADIVLFRRSEEQAELVPNALPAARRAQDRAAANSQRMHWLGRAAVASAAVVLASAVCIAIFGGRLHPPQTNHEVAQQAAAVVTPDAKPAGAALLKTASTETVSTQPVLTKSVSTEPVSTKGAEPARPRTITPTPAPAQPAETIAQDSESGSFDPPSGVSQSFTAASASASPTGRGAVPADEDNDQWVDDVGRQFEPMGSNLSQAFQFLWDAVPAGKAPAT